VEPKGKVQRKEIGKKIMEKRNIFYFTGE